MLGLSDVPHRVVATYLYEVPLSVKRLERRRGMTIVRALAADWQVGGTMIWQTRLPDRHQRRQHRRGAGAPGSRGRRRPAAAGGSVGLVRRPDGGDAAERPRHHAAEPDLSQIQPRRVRRPRRHDAERGGRRGSGPGTATRRRPTTSIRTDARFNIDISLRRDFPIAEYRLEVGVDVMNVLNHTQFNGAYAGGLGGTVPRRRTRRSASFRGWATPPISVPAAWARTIRGR